MYPQSKIGIPASKQYKLNALDTIFLGLVSEDKVNVTVEYNMDIMRQSACLVVNPITVDSYGFLFNCTTVGQASDLMTALT